MPRKASDASDDSTGIEREPRLATPRRELRRLDEAEAQKVEDVHAEIMEAMLTVSGEIGYRKVAVRHVLERYGGYRLQFYRHFESKAQCYAVAYEVEVERLVDGMLRAGAEEESWRDGLRAALEFLSAFIRERPALARGLLTEVHVAGGAALAKREEVFERLSHAIDSARRETGSRHSPPPVTAMFIVGAIDGAVGDVLARGAPEDFELAIPELVEMANVAYFGDQA
jgi:AcrR family transcriptional regulator